MQSYISHRAGTQASRDAALHNTPRSHIRVLRSRRSTAPHRTTECLRRTFAPFHHNRVLPPDLIFARSSYFVMFRLPLFSPIPHQSIPSSSCSVSRLPLSRAFHRALPSFQRHYLLLPAVVRRSCLPRCIDRPPMSSSADASDAFLMLFIGRVSPGSY